MTPRFLYILMAVSKGKSARVQLTTWTIWTLHKYKTTIPLATERMQISYVEVTTLATKHVARANMVLRGMLISSE